MERLTNQESFSLCHFLHEGVKLFEFIISPKIAKINEEHHTNFILHLTLVSGI